MKEFKKSKQSKTKIPISFHLLHSTINPRKNKPSKMSDNIPIELQIEIIKKVYDVKILIRFKSVSKQWKSFIESSDFVIGHSNRHPQPLTCSIIGYREDTSVSKENYVFFLQDGKNETLFNVSLSNVISKNIEKKFCISKIIGATHGLVCLYAFHKVYKQWMVIFSNPSIRKSIDFVAPYTQSYVCPTLAFGIRPDTLDPTVVKLTYAKKAMFWIVEFLSLSEGVWNNVIPNGNFPRQTIKFNDSTYVVLDRFVYWVAYELFVADDRDYNKNMLISFDLIEKEFKEIHLPDSLTNEIFEPFQLTVCKLRESLVVCGCIMVDGELQYCLWVMEDDFCFRKLYKIDANVYRILGFTKSGEAIYEPREEYGKCSTLHVYDPCSQQIKNLGITGIEGSFNMGLYNESILLNDH